jgi:hypothetical protein
MDGGTLARCARFASLLFHHVREIYIQILIAVERVKSLEHPMKSLDHDEIEE